MRPLYTTAFTLGWFAVAILSYAQVEADAPPTPRAKLCKMVDEGKPTGTIIESRMTMETERVAQAAPDLKQN
ncbi:hypothetical protein [Rhodoligotrophos defluvii]|uniref:hypothetical protein n=1 Tax=Rhodoligotrophos defluvii TaxID=2561934 RepID=UPI0010C98A5C|nr:hypothetical protein [Rhodoligotrophos defluvii]